MNDMIKTVVNRQKIVIRRDLLPEGSLRVAFLTDMHNACGPEESEFLFHALRRYRPDLVLVGGDMLIAAPGYGPEPARSFMLRLADEFPVYAASGNHEYRSRLYPEVYGSLYRDYMVPLRKAGVHFLGNHVSDLWIRGLPVRLIGFNAGTRYYQRFRRCRMEPEMLFNRLGRPPADEVSILLAHNPYYFRTYYAYGADLTLCGHCHGGIARLGKTRGLVSPDFRIFPKYVHGLTERNGKYLMVGAGLGEHTIPFRIHNPRELVALDILVNP